MGKAGTYGDVSLSDGIIEYAKTHEEIKGAFLTFQKDADQIYPGWKEQLGYTGESSVQAASFDWKKRGAAAAYVAEGFLYEKPAVAYCDQEFFNDVGYLPDGTPDEHGWERRQPPGANRARSARPWFSLAS